MVAAQDDAQPDLVVVELEVDDHEVVDGEPLNLSATVRNEGGDRAGMSELVFRRGDAQQSTVVDVEALSPGEQARVEETWTASEGEHTLHAIADGGDEVPESHESNNDAATSYEVDPRPSPNLAPTDVHLEPFDPPVEGDTVSAVVQVENLASPEHDEELATADTFTVSIWRNGELLEKTRTENRLEAGQDVDFEVGPWSAVTGQHEIGVAVDVADEVEEGDETDNAAIWSYETLASPPTPNLEPTDAFPLNQTLIEGQTITFGGLVGHTGGGVEDVQGSFSVDGTPVAAALVGDLPRGRSGSVVTLPVWRATAGVHELSFHVDPEDEVAETDESDNVLRTSFTVLDQADPAVREVRVEEPSLPWQGHAITVERANVGPGPMVENASLVLEVCPEPPSPTSGGCQTLDAPESFRLAPGESDTILASWDATGHVGEHRVCASVGYGLPQEATANDEACQQTFAIAAAGPVGGLALPTSQ